MNEQMRPCPFCGGGFIHVSRIDHQLPPAVVPLWVVVCDGCGYTLGQQRKRFVTKDEAIAAWNYPTTDLLNLLAVINGDGGHYVAKHGRGKAVEDAKQVVNRLKQIEAIAKDAGFIFHPYDDWYPWQ